MNLALKKPVAIAIAVVCLIAAGFIATRSLSGPQVRTGAQATWYYVLESSELVAAPHGNAPITLPDGRQAVHAKVFGCGGCEADARAIGYLESFTDKAKSVIDAGPPEGDRTAYDDAMTNGRRIAAVPQAGQGIQWLSAQDPEAARIMSEASQRCQGQKAQACYP